MMKRLSTPVVMLELGLVFAALVMLGWRFHLISSAYTDSWAPMNAALEVLDGPDAGELYDITFFSKGIKFQYPPSALFYLEALDAFGLNTSRRLNAVNWGLLVANAILVGVVAARLFAGPDFRRFRRVICLACFFCALAYGPIAVGFSIGQIQILVNLMFTAACLALLYEGSVSAGALIGAATAIKPQFGFLLLLAALQRHWRFVVGFLAAAGSLGLLSIALYGWSNHVDYLAVLRHLSERGETYAWNNSVNGILNRWLGNGSSFDVVPVAGVHQSVLPPYHPVVYWASLATTVLLLALPLALPFAVPKAAREGAGRLLLFLIGAVCSVIASPVAWIHHFGILLPVNLFVLSSTMAAATSNETVACCCWPSRLPSLP
jgi:hypothetical protein